MSHRFILTFAMPDETDRDEVLEALREVVVRLTGAPKDGSVTCTHLPPAARFNDRWVACPSCGNTDPDYFELLEDILSTRDLKRSEPGLIVAEGLYKDDPNGCSNLRLFCVARRRVPVKKQTEIQRQHPELAYETCATEFTIPEDVELEYE